MLACAFHNIIECNEKRLSGPDLEATVDSEV